MVLPPPKGLKIFIAPESAPFFTSRIGRVASATSKLTLAAVCRMELDIIALSEVTQRFVQNAEPVLAQGPPFAHVLGQVESTERETTIGRSSV